MKIAVVDTETTGLGPRDQVVEIAAVMLDAEGREQKRGRWWTLVRPTVSISLEARAVHHITDAELRKAQTMSQLMDEGELDFLAEADVIVGHNLEFDLRMLVQSGLPSEQMPTRRLCTYRCGVSLYPNSPRHTNQVLRYFLELDVPVALDMPPHRALPDALVTAAVLRRMIKDVGVEALLKRTAQPVILARVPMGKNRGRPWSEMDAGFLGWVLKRDFSDEIKETARHWMERVK